MKRLVVPVVLMVVAVMVWFDGAMAGTKVSGEVAAPLKEGRPVKDQGVNGPSMKEVLLHPQGFEMVWECGGRVGWSIVFFREIDQEIVANITVVDIEGVDINDPANFGPERCFTDAKWTDQGILFNGCSPASKNIPLTFHPKNRKTPFKGSGPDCPSIELHPR